MRAAGGPFKSLMMPDLIGMAGFSVLTLAIRSREHW